MMNCPFYFVVSWRLGGGGGGAGVCAHMGVRMAAGHLSDKEERVWGRNNPLHPRGSLAQGPPVGPRAVFLWLPSHPGSAAYTCTCLHTYHLYIA